LFSSAFERLAGEEGRKSMTDVLGQEVDQLDNIICQRLELHALPASSPVTSERESTSPLLLNNRRTARLG
jgi:hypothetical protein